MNGVFVYWDNSNIFHEVHRFAGAFLMPADVLRMAVGRRRTSVGWNELFSLKRRFGVSVQALVYRCRDLGIINDALYGRLFRAMSGFGWRSPPYAEPAQLAPERPSRFERLCSRAVAESVISDAKAAELLDTSVRELHRRMEQPPEFGSLATINDEGCAVMCRAQARSLVRANETTKRWS